MYLIDEQQRSLPELALLARLLERAFQIGDAREHRRKLHEAQPRRIRQQPRDRRLADTRRPPQDKRRQRLPPQHARQHPGLAQQVILAHDIAKHSRPQPVREGRRGFDGEQVVVIDVAGH